MDSENVKFEIQNEYSIEDFKDFWIGFRLKSPGKAPPEQVSSHSMRVLFWFLIFAGVTIEIAYLCLHPVVNMPYLKYAWIFCIPGIIGLIRGVPKHPRWVQKVWKSHQKQQWKYFIVRFTEDDFQLYSSNRFGNSDCRYSYSFINQLWEDKRHFYIGTSGNALHILQKSGFIQGAPSDFVGFIAEKTGTPVQQINGEHLH